jgi:hypothetical protein
MPKIGDNVASVASDIGSQVKSAWIGINNSTSALELKEQLLAEKNLLIAPLVSFIIMPLIYLVLNRSYYYGGYELYQFLGWVNRVATGITIGTLVYFAISKNDKFNLTFSAIYSVVYLLFNLSNLKYMGFWQVLMCILKYPICWLILKELSKAIPREDIRPVVFTACAFLFMQYIFSWITYFNLYLYFNIYSFASLVIEVATVYLIFKKRHGINIFQFYTV